MNRFIGRLVIIGLIIPCMLAGCGRSGPTQFYLLNPVSPVQPAPAASRIAIGVGPVTLPDYLDRPQIVTRAGSHRLILGEFDKWAGSLKDDLPQVIAENLSRLLNTDRVSVVPWTAATPVDYQITLRIIRFDGPLGGEVELRGRWGVIDDRDARLVAMENTVIRTPAHGPGYAGLVEAQSHAVAQLCLKMAETLTTLQPPEKK